MRAFYMEQGTAEWFAVHCRRITASRISDVLAIGPKGGEYAPRTNYRWDLVSERMTGDISDRFVSKWMKRGRELEYDARMAYGMACGVLVEEIGFAIHPSMEFSGASPDGLIEDDGGLEIKVPAPNTHLQYLLAARQAKHASTDDVIECFDTNVIPEEYRSQMEWGMDCCEREWWDFWSWHPKLPSLKIRLHRDEKRIAYLESSVREFDAEINDVIASIEGRGILAQLKASLEVV